MPWSYVGNVRVCAHEHARGHVCVNGGASEEKWASTSLSDPVHVSVCGPGINLALSVLILELIYS